jgi:hypothetical protein
LGDLPVFFLGWHAGRRTQVFGHCFSRRLDLFAAVLRPLPYRISPCLPNDFG